MGKHNQIITGTDREFINAFRDLCINRNSWQVWADVITSIACAISNAIDHTPGRYEKREEEYLQCSGRLGDMEKVVELMNIITKALETNPDQDFLGEMYMRLEMGNHWKGQFFTPYHVCEAMAAMALDEEVLSQVYEKGYIAINDPACGAGATLVAAANNFRKKNVDYQRHVLFVAQDIDRIVGMMCYIQLSLLGCPGYVAIANTLTNPLSGNPLFPEEKEDQEFWYTPMFQEEVWRGRRLFHSLDIMTGARDRGTVKISIEEQELPEQKAPKMKQETKNKEDKALEAVKIPVEKHYKAKVEKEGQMTIFDLLEEE